VKEENMGCKKLKAQILTGPMSLKNSSEFNSALASDSPEGSKEPQPHASSSYINLFTIAFLIFFLNALVSLLFTHKVVLIPLHLSTKQVLLVHLLLW